MWKVLWTGVRFSSPPPKYQIIAPNENKKSKTNNKIEE